MSRRPRTCTHGDTDVRYDGEGWRRCYICARVGQRRRNKVAFDARHLGHEVVDLVRTRDDGTPWRRCITCAPPTPVYVRPPVDENAVLRAVAGDPPKGLNVSERREAILQLHPDNTASEIARRIRCSRRTVERHLAAAA